MQRCLQFLAFIVALDLAFGQTTIVDFCTKYSTCRSKARSQLTKCTGGLTQMVLNKHGSNISAIESAESFKICNSEIAEIINKFVKDYERIDEKTLQCTKVASPSLLEKTQELICQAVYNETDLDRVEPQGIESNFDCYQVYESELDRCNMVRDCCPQFESCREKIEKESGIATKEKAIVSKMHKCFDKSGVVLGESEDPVVEKEDKSQKEDVDIRFAPARQTPPPHRFEPWLPVGTPVPRIKNGTITEHGVFIIKPHNQLKRKHKSPPKDEEQSVETALNSELIAKKLENFQATQPIAVKQHESLKKRKEQHDQIPAHNLSNKRLLNEMLCRQYDECERILQAEERECELAFGHESPPDDTGITDTEIRAIFLNNSHTQDPQIRRKCLANVDSETQKHLEYFKQEIGWQNEKCAFESGPDSVDLNGCQKLEVLSELFALKKANDDPLSNSAEKCKGRLSSFRQKCNALQKCCPQRVSCELSNQSEEVRKYGDIIGQLKMEQILCEARLQRIQGESHVKLEQINE